MISLISHRKCQTRGHTKGLELDLAIVPFVTGLMTFFTKRRNDDWVWRRGRPQI